MGFGSPAALNSNAAQDFGDDLTPQLATDSDDTWIVVWDTYDSRNSTIGADFDILTSFSDNLGTQPDRAIWLLY